MLTLETLERGRASLDTANRYHRDGLISDETFAAFRHLWQTSAPRFAVQACHCDTCRAAPSYPLDAPEA